jgi:hypothetical protein
VEPSPKNHPSRQIGHCFLPVPSRGIFFPLFSSLPQSINGGYSKCLTHSLASADVLQKLALFAEKERYPIFPSLAPIPSCLVSSRGTNPYTDQVQRSTPVMHQLPDLRKRMHLRTRSRCIQSRRSAETSASEKQIRQSEDRLSQRYGSPRIISHR